MLYISKWLIMLDDEVDVTNSSMNRYIFDLNKAAYEIYTYISYALNIERSSIKAEAHIRVVEGLLLELIKDNINFNTHRLIRSVSDYELLGMDSPYTPLSKLMGVEVNGLKDLVEGLVSVGLIMDKIDEIMGSNTFELWTIERVGYIYVFESLGDFRILEWETEHLVGGKYVKHKRRR